jgi:phosphatidylserine/phosphatidylglycerophosphate/cardiolipin synthase-like enzyme
MSIPISILDYISLFRSCVDVAAEIIKCIQAQFPDAPDDKLRETVQDNLRVCFVRCQRGGSNYSGGGSLGLHSKHFIVDDVCCYIGSQNLYTCDLAEWGVVIDSPEAVADIKQNYWDQLWKVSYTKDDCDVDEVMDGLGIDRTAVNKLAMTKYEYEKAKAAMKANLQQRWDSDQSDQSDAEDESGEEKS